MQHQICRRARLSTKAAPDKAAPDAIDAITKMVNYSKWDAIGDSSDDEAPSRLAQDVQT